MSARNALILAGSGMLSDIAEQLASDGWRVVLPSRRYNPLPARDPQTAGTRVEHGSGRAVWVEADWERPDQLVRRTDAALTGPVELLVAWVHESYRRAVVAAVEPLLADGAPVVEVRAAGSGRIPGEPDPLLARHPTHAVVLGGTSEHDPRRPLGHEEIVHGVLAAVRRALSRSAPARHQLGQRRPVL